MFWRLEVPKERPTLPVEEFLSHPGMAARSKGITRWVLKTRYMLSQSVKIVRSLARSREQFVDVTLRPDRVR